MTHFDEDNKRFIILVMVGTKMSKHYFTITVGEGSREHDFTADNLIILIWTDMYNYASGRRSYAIVKIKL